MTNVNVNDVQDKQQELIITKLPTKTPTLLIRGLYNQIEKEAIWQELSFLAREHKMLPPEETGTAVDAGGVPKKSNRGLFLDELYSRREVSSILDINRNIFSEEVLQRVEQYGDIFKYLRHSRHDSTLLSYYEKNDHYKPHSDTAVLSAITYVWKEPKQFGGGVLSFTEDNYKVLDVMSFDVVMFPSFMLHEVSEVHLKDGVPAWQCNGRFAITQFIKV
jgi:hypothetical protein